MQELKGRDTRKFMVNRGNGDGGGRSEEGSDLKSARDSESDEEVSMGIGGGLRREDLKVKFILKLRPWGKVYTLYKLLHKPQPLGPLIS